MADSEAGTEVPVIRVVGPLVMTTEVFLWEDVGVIRSGAASRNGFLSSEPATSFSFPKSRVTVDEETSIVHTVTGRLHLHGTVEEPRLAYEMDALGLPLSFGTSKVSNNTPSRSKRKSTKPKSASRRKDINRPVPEVTVFNEVEKAGSSKFLHDSPGMSSCLCTTICQTDTSYHDANEQYKDDWYSEESASIAALGSRNVTDEKLDLVEVSDLNVQNIIKSEVSPDTVCFERNTEVLGSLSLYGDNCPEDVFEEACFQPEFQQDVDLLNKDDLEKCSVDSCTSFCNKHSKEDKADTETMQWCSVSAEAVVFHPLGDHPDNFICHECGNWRVIWDSFYRSNYFFNVESHESTWHPPPGLEKYALSCSNLGIKESDFGSDEEDAGSEHACGSMDEITDSLMKNEGSFHFTDKQPADEQLVETSAKMESGTDFLSHCTTVGIENSNMQWSLYPSLVMNGMEDEKNDCKDLDKKKGKQHDILGSYYCSQSTINEDRDESLELNPGSSVDVLDSYENAAINKKRRIRRPQSYKGHGLTRCISNILVKYWCQRYSLFTRFDDGIKMDDESWFSVTPELIAKHHAFRCGGGSIIDCFTGVGGNAIQFAMRTNHVIAIDVDPVKIDYAQHNAVIYGVSERIDFIKGDFFKIAPNLKGDVVFLSPPWGGPDYAKAQIYDMGSLKPHDGYHLFKTASMIAAKIVMFLPRNVNLDQLTDLSLSTDPPWKLEYVTMCIYGNEQVQTSEIGLTQEFRYKLTRDNCAKFLRGVSLQELLSKKRELRLRLARFFAPVEKNYLNGKLKSITAYFDNTGE